MTVAAEERVKINDSEQENYVTLPETTFTADANGCIHVSVALDKAEEKNVRAIVNYSSDNGSFILPMTMSAGKTKGTFDLCSEQTGGKIEAGKSYTLKIMRILLR